MNNVLITGGAGFIGSTIARAVLARGAKVTVLDAMLPLYGGNEFNLIDVEDRVHFIKGDIRDRALVEEVVSGKDLIFNLAGQVSYIDSAAEPFLDLDINGNGHLIVLEAVRRYAPEAKVLFSSSRLVYGRIRTKLVSEDHPTEPLSLYGIHKLLAEKYYQYYNQTFGIDTVSVRIPNPYGPRQQMKHNKYSIVGWFIRQAMDGSAIEIFGNGDQDRDYLYIDDIVDAFLRLAEQGRAGDVYNIGTHERVKFVEMVDAVIEAVGSGEKRHIPWPEHYERNETGNYVANTTKIEKATGWRAKTTLSEGIRRTVQYYQAHRSHYW